MLHIIHIIEYTFVPLHPEYCERRAVRTDCTSRHSSDTQLIGSENTVLDNHRVLISLLEPLISRDLHYRLLAYFPQVPGSTGPSLMIWSWHWLQWAAERSHSQLLAHNYKSIPIWWLEEVAQCLPARWRSLHSLSSCHHIIDQTRLMLAIELCLLSQSTLC